ncbi:hypothetical protein ElP_43230 [Tautonia plasticadhaerens]|uniref:Uncharacterized protein n=1 Tax=Tautonia plasticadhaerens TaxID=2527974 RepID=A0A518H6D4_9BACT|nr:hypothetical protein ElP_43230 [Tautonia plasticadhaerens]
MTTRYYHSPPPVPSTRVRCPVCNQAVYSRGDIHPQCAVRRADPPRPKARPKPSSAQADPATKPAGEPADAGT